MAQAAVAAEVHQTLDVHLDLAPQVAFDLVLGVDDLADAPQLAFVERVGDLVGRDLGGLADVGGGLGPNAEQVAQRNHDVLTTRKVDACDACHVLSSTLSLLVPRILTQDSDHAPAAHDLALVTDFLDAG